MSSHSNGTGTGSGINLSAMLAFIPRLMSMLHVEMLVHGNATAEEVRSKSVSMLPMGLRREGVRPRIYMVSFLACHYELETPEVACGVSEITSHLIGERNMWITPANMRHPHRWS